MTISSHTVNSAYFESAIYDLLILGLFSSKQNTTKFFLPISEKSYIVLFKIHAYA